MTFTNHELTTSDMPKLEALTTQALSPKYRPTNMVTILAFFILVIGLLTLVRFQPFFTLAGQLINLYPFALSILIALGLILCVYHYFADPIKCYAIREQDISFISGLFFRKTICQPILRIQHIEVKRGPIERAAGLASLQVFSAGGAMHTFEIPGLELELAQKLRQFILDHKDINRHG